MAKCARTKAAIAGLLLVAAIGPFGASGAGAATEDVIVQGPSAAAAAVAVERVGGDVERVLGLVDGVAADVTAEDAASLRAMGLSVTPDLVMHPTGKKDGGTGSVEPQVTAMSPVADAADAGNGIGVALVDTGVAPHPDLDRVVVGPDFSGEGDGLDRYGHGTFMAGLIVGTRTGLAPGASLVSVKVAGADGSTSLSRVIDAIGWVVTHRDEHRIKVLNLSFSTVAPTPYHANPLDAAVEAAWASNIAVVTAAGNNADHVTSPGDDPYAITVGALDVTGAVATWSGRQQFATYSKPELVAPGQSTVSLRVVGSTIDRENPSARIGDGYFKGTGTSMATALVAGAAASLASHHPSASPDDIKGALVDGGRSLPGTTAKAVDVAAADATTAREGWEQHHKLAFGNLGFPELNAGMPWTAGSWTAGSWTAGSWTAGSWTAGSWTAGSWTAGSWTAGAWTAGSWTGASWTAGSWTAGSWTAGSWTAGSWTAGSWTAGSWTAGSWTAGSWTAGSWTAGSWTAGSWTAGSWTAGAWTAGAWTAAAWT